MIYDDIINVQINNNPKAVVVPHGQAVFSVFRCLSNKHFRWDYSPLVGDK